MAKRKHRFVVGYKGDGNVVYGKYNSATPFTLFQAKCKVKKLPSGSVIFKLVELKGQ